ncbi:MAG TPA: CHAT domain-containing protein [Solirubrobacteraceae bacterium]|nr:CHAT domain-containing protein [Solirubrobacteraceae bacterium]
MRQGESGWKVSAVEYPDGDWIAEEADVDLSTVRGHVARVFRYWGRRGRGDPGEEIRRLGAILAAVLPGAIEQRFTELMRPGHEPLEVAIRFDDNTDPDLVYLPWEHLYFASRGITPEIYVAREDKLAFVRALEPELHHAEAPARRTLDVLLVEVDPDRAVGYADFDGDDERSSSCVASVCDAVETEAAESEGVNVRRVQAPDVMRLAEELARNRYDIVHYVGFGRFVAGATDELALGRGRGIGYVDAAAFQASFADAAPRLVLLQTCDGPQEDMPADLSVFALPLLAASQTAAVVAYQFPIVGRLSRHFNEVLYKQLLAGASIEMAVQAGRRRQWMADQRSRAFLSAATFVRQPGELRLVAPAGDASPRARTSALTAYA